MPLRHLLVLALLAAGGCGESRVVPLQPSVLYPTGLAYHEGHGRLLVGGYHDGAVQEIDLRGGSRRVLLAPGIGRQRALRLRVDAARDRLWVLDIGEVRIHDLATGMVVRRVPLTGWLFTVYSCLPDLALDPAGAGYVSSNVTPVLWRIDPDTFEQQRIEVWLGADGDKDFGFNGLAFARDRSTLFAVSAQLGALWAIETGSARASKIQLTTHVRGGCGLAIPERVNERAITVAVAGGFRNGVYAVHVSPDLRRGYVVRTMMGEATDAPIGVAAVKSVVVAIGSQLSRHPDYFGDGKIIAASQIIPMIGAIPLAGRDPW